MRTLLVVLLLSTAMSGQGKPDLLLKADPQMAFLGTPVKVSVTIPPHPDVVGARVQLFPFADSAWQIDPRKDNGTERRDFVFKIPEPGEFELFLLVYDRMGKELARRVVPIKRVYPDQ
jgi:hypothetical protein